MTYDISDMLLLIEKYMESMIAILFNFNHLFKIS